MYSHALTTPLLLTALLATTPALATPPSANMTITVSNDPNCNANGLGINFTIPLSYSAQIANFDNDSMQIQSYSLSRPTTLQEQLDFSGPAKDGAAGDGDGDGDDGVPVQCALFHETTSPDSNGHVLMAEHCYGFLTGPAECLRLWQRG